MFLLPKVLSFSFKLMLLHNTLIALSATLDYSCKSYIATIPISTQNQYLAITPPANQSAITAFITSYTSQTPRNFILTNTNGSPQSININDTYQIYTQLCTPSIFRNGSDVEFLVHGYVIVSIKKKWTIHLMICHFPESGLTIHIGTLEEMGLRITMLNQR